MSTVMDSHSLRRLVYALFLTVAAATVAERIVAVTRLYEPSLFRLSGQPESAGPAWPERRPEPMPTLGANDRSRWATIRALVDDGTYAIGYRDFDAAGQLQRDARGRPLDHGMVTEDDWRTIDLVLHPETHRFYSSKPPLLPTLIAGEYWLLKRLFGWSIVEQRGYVMRVILLTFNGLPLVFYLCLLIRLAERYGTTDWGRLYVLAAASFGTFMVPFSATLNNHTPAACCALMALYATLAVWETQRPTVAGYLVAGFFAGCTAGIELPAASFAAVLFVWLLLKSPRRALLIFVPAAVIPITAALWTNYLALGRWEPVYTKFGTPWYDFEGSNWKIDSQKPPQGIDGAGLKESRMIYAFHLLLGHHGAFSLTPIFLWSLAGMSVGLYRIIARLRKASATSWILKLREQSGLSLAAVLSMAVTLVIFVFYISVLGDRSRNYGGVASGPRWLFWLTPLWLLTMFPTADWLAGRRWRRGLGYLLLGISVFSVNYPSWNPWHHPWIYDFMKAHGWIHY